MKTILSLLIIIAALPASADVTNIVVKIDTVVEGATATNTTSTTLKLNGAGSAKDTLTVNALNFYYNYAKTNGMANNGFSAWLEDTAKAALQQHNAAFSTATTGFKADKIANQAKTDSSVFTQSQRNQIDAIYATLPP